MTSFKLKQFKVRLACVFLSILALGIPSFGNFLNEQEKISVYCNEIRKDITKLIFTADRPFPAPTSSFKKKLKSSTNEATYFVLCAYFYDFKKNFNSHSKMRMEKKINRTVLDTEVETIRVLFGRLVFSDRPQKKLLLLDGNTEEWIRYLNEIVDKISSYLIKLESSTFENDKDKVKKYCENIHADQTTHEIVPGSPYPRPKVVFKERLKFNRLETTYYVLCSYLFNFEDNFKRYAKARMEFRLKRKIAENEIEPIRLAFGNFVFSDQHERKLELVGAERKALEKYYFEIIEKIIIQLQKTQTKK